MSEPIALTLGQKFELERMSRVIDSTGDAQLLRGLAKQLLNAWQAQRAATDWVMRQQLGSPTRFGGGSQDALANPVSAADHGSGNQPVRSHDVL